MALLNNRRDFTMTIDDCIRTLRQPSATKVRTAVVSLLTDMRNEFAEPRVRALIAKRIEALGIWDSA
jgi:hypothetical protein